MKSHILELSKRRIEKLRELVVINKVCVDRKSTRSKKSSYAIFR